MKWIVEWQDFEYASEQGQFTGSFYPVIKRMVFSSKRAAEEAAEQLSGYASSGSSAEVVTPLVFSVPENNKVD